MTAERRFGEDDQGRQHPEDLRHDLNPASEDLERSDRNAFDLKPAHRTLSEIPDDVLRRIPVVSEGSRLKQGATYVDIASAGKEFSANGDMRAGRGSLLVPKAAVDYEAWNLLLDHLARARSR